MVSRLITRRGSWRVNASDPAPYERRVQQLRADFNAADWRPGLHVPGLETIGRASSLQVLLAIGRGIGPGEASMAAFGV